MMPAALFSLLFGTEDACLPVGRPACRRQGRPKIPIINYAPIRFLPFPPTAKVADNQN